MFVRKKRPAVPVEAVTGLLHRLCSVRDDQARMLAERWVDSPFAAAARKKVLHPKTLGVVDLLAALELLGERWPLPLVCPADVAAYRAAGDALIATYGRHRLTTAQYLTLIGPSLRADLATR